MEIFDGIFISLQNIAGHNYFPLYCYSVVIERLPNVIFPYYFAGERYALLLMRKTESGLIMPIQPE